MALSFPTGHRYAPYSQGTPTRARPCQCETPIIDPIHDADLLHCIRCGKLRKQTINQTFHERAMTLKAKAA